LGQLKGYFDFRLYEACVPAYNNVIIDPDGNGWIVGVWDRDLNYLGAIFSYAKVISITFVFRNGQR
jgi:hypothetical protein